MTTPEIPYFQPEAAGPTRLPNIVHTAPAKIYLVIGEDCPPEEDFKVLASAAGEDLTWCEDKIDANSIGYVREDLADRQALLDACKAMIAWDEAEKAARPWSEDGGKSWHERLDACALAFEKARAAIAKATGAQA